MRKSITLSILLIFITVLVNANHRFDFLEGKYGNYHYDMLISVKSIKGGIKVKGLPGKRGWQKFYITRYNILKERHGPQRIIISDRHKLILQNRRRGHKLGFTRVTGKNKYRNYHRERRFYSTPERKKGSQYQKDHRYDFQNYDYDRNRYNDYGINNDYGIRNGYEAIASNFIGEWYSNKLRKLLIIEKDGNGIKARLSGDKNWTKYRRGNSGEFIDKKGNRYFLEGNDKLIWQDKAGNNSYTLFRS